VNHLAFKFVQSRKLWNQTYRNHIVFEEVSPKAVYKLLLR